MSIATQPSLYRERTARVTEHAQIDRALQDLAQGKSRFARTSTREKIALVQDCIEGVKKAAQEWVKAACDAKDLRPGSPTRGEEVAAGPLATMRYLRLLLLALTDIDRSGKPQLPGGVNIAANGTLRIPVIPAKGLFDSLVFQGFRAQIWMQQGVTRENLPQHMATYYAASPKPEGISLVLGAGNVSSIAPMDAFSKLFHEGKVVLLKMNPVNEYLGPFFERAFHSLIDAGYLRVIYGGAEAGSYAVAHDLVDEVHITGSVYSHESIVWGPPGPERERRKAANEPLLNKRITSELGNVTPWIVVPGPYSDKELQFQAENVASMITNNASFNCIATKMVVTWKGWNQRDRFLDLLEGILAKVPPRKAYYPGACDRFDRFAPEKSASKTGDQLPWTLRRGVDAQRDPLYCREESFVCVCAETQLDAASPVEFMNRAADFANDDLWGTLGAGIMIHPRFRREGQNEAKFQQMLGKLRYGTIGVNHWPALSYAMITPPWGGYPGATIHDPQSGIDWVHNTYMLEGIEKTVLEGPLSMFPKPFWFPTHQGAEGLAWKVFELYYRPSALKLPSIFLSALKG